MKFLLTFLIFALFISVIANAYFYLNPKETTIIKQEMPKAETEKIREIASICSMSPEAFEQASLLSNLSEIKSFLWNNTRTCNLSPLSQDEIKVLDEKEYAHHRATYQYGDDLDIVLKYTTQVTIKRMKERVFPFDDERIRKYFDQFLEMTKKKD